MKLLNTLLLIVLFIESHGQQQENNKNIILIFLGAKTRITPIYLKHVPDVIHLGNINALEQPDKHLSGPGLLLSEKRRLGLKHIFSLHQVIRYDYIYQRIPLVTFPPDNFKYEIKKKIIFDISGDITRTIPLKNSFLSISVGASICGINSGYIETERVYQTQTTYTDYERKKNFIFPAITAGAGWQKSKFLAELKFGYCWNNPTLYDTPFIFPEISLQYQLFQLKKK